MAPNLQLHRYLNLHDSEETHVFTFLLENPDDLYSIEVRSNQFRFGGLDWYVYTSRSSAEYISLYLRVVHMDKGVSANLKYAFSIVNPQNAKATVRNESPPEGRTFSEKDEVFSWGWKEFARKDRVCQRHRGYIYDINKLEIQLEIKQIRIFYEEELTLPGIDPTNPFTVIECNQFTVGGFAWRLVVYPNGEDMENRGKILVRLQCATGRQLSRCRTKIYLNEVYQSDEVESIFPANEISETDRPAKFDGRAGQRLFDSEVDIHLKIEFLQLSYMVEEFIPLSNPDTYPIFVLNEFEDLTSTQWTLKTLLGDFFSFKLDMPDLDSNSIPEMHHKYVAWDVYLVPSRVVLNRDKAHEPVRERLIRAATSTMLARAPNMTLINDKGRLSGYFNESWSESEVCKFNINPRDFFNDSDYTFVSSKNDLLTFAVRIEFTTQLLVFKTPAPSPTSDKERRNVIKLHNDNKLLKYQLGSLSRDYELLSLAVPNSQQVKTVSIKFSSDFAWRLMQLFSTGDIEDNIQQRPYISPAEAGCATPTILPEKVQKSQLSELKSKVEELTDEILQICEKGLNLSVQRFYLGGPIYLQTFCPAKPHGVIVIYSKSLPFNAQRKWQPAFLQVVAEEVKNFASKSDQILQFLQGAFPGRDCLQDRR